MRRAFLFAILAMLLGAPSLHAETLTGQIDPAEVNVGDEVTVTYTIQNTSFEKVALPAVEGLQVEADPTMTTSITFSLGKLTRSMSEMFRLVPTHSGDFTIPAFDIAALDGNRYRTKPLTLKVVVAGTAIPTDSIAAPPSPSPAAVVVNSPGPVVMPPNTPGVVPGAESPDATDTPDPYASVPKDADGGPAKVFMLITPETTDAYVGQAVPIQIDFYIRMESNADQNSLPTIKGSDFLMNNFSIRGRASLALVENIQYERDTWRSAISAPKNGDFPLVMERDTYWEKSTANNSNNDPFSGFFNRHQNLAHEMIASNQFIVHVHPLPDEGRPAQFTGAIGQFKVIGSAAPSAIGVGEPVKLSFSVTGVGNFDYVRCPLMPDDPSWKTYVPTSKTSFMDESRTHGVKDFEQSVVAQKNGNVPLKAAVFSYFDPALKQYVTTPIALPEITVSGDAPSTAAIPPDATGNATMVSTTPLAVDDLVPNRLKVGPVFASLTPAYRQSWFWMVQVVLVIVALLGGLFFLLRPRKMDDRDRAERTRFHSSRQQEEQAMSEAVSRNDALAFFIAARHAVQLQLGSQWQVPPEALTLGEIRRRDPHLADALEPLFRQADEVIYSGKTHGPIDLAAWERTVHDLLQPLTVAA